jgi:hypothetical protein
VLLVFSDRDALFPGAEHHGTDLVLVTPEIAMWRNGCNCKVSIYVQPNAGHVGLFHRTSKQLANRILDWLDDHDLQQTRRGRSEGDSCAGDRLLAELSDAEHQAMY